MYHATVGYSTPQSLFPATDNDTVFGHANFYEWKNTSTFYICLRVLCC